MDTIRKEGFQEPTVIQAQVIRRTCLECIVLVFVGILVSDFASNFEAQNK